MIRKVANRQARKQASQSLVPNPPNPTIRISFYIAFGLRIDLITTAETPTQHICVCIYTRLEARQMVNGNRLGLETKHIESSAPGWNWAEV